MHTLIIILAICGGIWLLLQVVLPVAEAILYGVLSTWLVILNTGWKSFRPKCWWWLIRSPWVGAASRLFGVAVYETERTVGNWRYRPPFKLYRINKRVKGV
jgi:hypothetical protein